MVFVREMLILRAFVLKGTETTRLLQKKVLVILKIAIRLRDRQAFMVQSLEILNFFHYFTFETSFLQNANSFLENRSFIFWFKVR